MLLSGCASSPGPHDSDPVVRLAGHAPPRASASVAPDAYQETVIDAGYVQLAAFTNPAGVNPTVWTSDRRTFHHPVRADLRAVHGQMHWSQSGPLSASTLTLVEHVPGGDANRTRGPSPLASQLDGMRMRQGSELQVTWSIPYPCRLDDWGCLSDPGHQAQVAYEQRVTIETMLYYGAEPVP
jgi:hypothetical protein